MLLIVLFDLFKDYLLNFVELLIKFQDLISIVINTVLTLLIIWQTKKNNERINEVTISANNHQIDLSLINLRIKIFDGFVGIMSLTSIDIKKQTILYVTCYLDCEKISDDLLKRNNELTVLLNEAKLAFFHDKMIINYLNDIYNSFVKFQNAYLDAYGKCLNYRENFDKLAQHMLGVEEILIEDKKKNANKFLNDNELTWNEFFDDMEKQKMKLNRLISSNKFVELFKPYINIPKKGRGKT